jgi:hypothetical protein
LRFVGGRFIWWNLFLLNQGIRFIFFGWLHKDGIFSLEGARLGE